jgi:hypothetical protein
MSTDETKAGVVQGVSKPKNKGGRPKGSKTKNRKVPASQILTAEAAIAVARVMGKVKPTQALEARVKFAQHGPEVIRYLDRRERLLWLADRVAKTHTKAQAVKMRVDGVDTVEIVHLPTEEPQERAMELLMRALGDFGAGTNVQVNVSGEDEGKAGPRVALLVMDNGRGPTSK